MAREINKFLSFHPCYIYIHIGPNDLDDPSTLSPAVQSKTRSKGRRTVLKNPTIAFDNSNERKFEENSSEWNLYKGQLYPFLSWYIILDWNSRTRVKVFFSLCNEML